MHRLYSLITNKKVIPVDLDEGEIRMADLYVSMTGIVDLYVSKT